MVTPKNSTGPLEETARLVLTFVALVGLSLAAAWPACRLLAWLLGALARLNPAGYLWRASPLGVVLACVGCALALLSFFFVRSEAPEVRKPGKDSEIEVFETPVSRGCRIAGATLILLGLALAFS